MRVSTWQCKLDYFNCFAWEGDGDDGDDHRISYTRELLLELRPLAAAASGNIPLLLRSKGNATTGDRLPQIHRRKRRRRGGIQRRLPDRRQLPPLPSILLSNVQSIRNKVDEREVYARCKRGFRDTCLLAFTETWLGDSRRSPVKTNKSTRGGACFYINERYWNTVNVLEEICTSMFYLLHPGLHSSAPKRIFSRPADRGGDQQTLGNFNLFQIYKSLKTYEQY